MFFLLFQAVIPKPEQNPFVNLGLVTIMILLAGWIVGWLMARRYYNYKEEEEELPDHSEEIVMNIGCNYRIRIVGANNCSLFEKEATRFDNDFEDGTVEFITVDGKFGSVRSGKNLLIIEELSPNE